jgi:hypothetical protein
MFDDLEALFMENVLAAYNEFSQSLSSDTSGHNNDIRLGINAAVALYHLREHFPAAARKTRAQLAAACSDYDILGDVVNAAKHKALTHRPPQVAAASDIYEEIAYTLYQDQEGDYWDAEKMVTVKLIDGSTRNLRDILTNVLNMWIDEFHARGALLSLSKVVSPLKGIPQRRSKSGAFGMSLEPIFGIRFLHRMRLQRYNYLTGLVEPFRDVKEATFSIYKPPTYTVEVALQLITGEIIRKDIPLTDDESLAYYRIETDEERSRFIEQLAQKRDFIGQAIQEFQEKLQNESGG